MVKLIKDKAFAIRGFWGWYIYWIPTFQTEFHGKESILNNINIGNDYSAKGKCFTINIYILVLNITIDFWWNLTSKNYGNN